jgi:hypothetical protein
VNRYKKLLAAIIAGLAVFAVSIPADADPRFVAAGQIITALAVLFAPANTAPNQRAADEVFGPRRNPPAGP